MVSLNQRLESAEKPVFMPLRDPVTGDTFKDDGKEQGLLVVSPLSKNYAQRKAKIQQKYLAIAGTRVSRAENAADAQGIVMEEVEKLADTMGDEMVNAQLLCVVGWENMDVVDTEGKPLEFSPESLQRLVNSAPWIVDQLGRFLEDTANFFTELRPDLSPGSSTKSGSLKPTTKDEQGAGGSTRLQQRRASRRQN